MSIFNLARRRRINRAQRQRTGWIGVEITTNTIRIAQLERVARRYRLARSLVIPAEDGRVFDESCIEDGQLGPKIREALTLHGGFCGRTAACAVSMEFAELRTLISARGSEDEQRELITLELGDGLPGEAGIREFDFWDASHRFEDENGMTQVHVLSMARSLSEGITTNLLRGGLKCQILDGIPFTSLRAVEMLRKPDVVVSGEEEFVAVLNWEYETATLVVIHDGEPLMTRSLRNCGLNRLLDKICQRLNLSSMEAGMLLANYGIQTPTRRGASSGDVQEIISSLAADLLKEIADELNETFAFVRAQFTGSMPAKVWIIGAGSPTRNVDAWLELHTGVPAASWTIDGPGCDSQPSSIFATAAALSALAWEL